jgi:hypothetical protein
MTIVSATVDVIRLVDSLKLKDKQRLLNHLRLELSEEDFSVQLSDEDLKFDEIDAEVDDIDLDEILWQMSTSEKQQLYDELDEEFGDGGLDDDDFERPNSPEELFAQGSSYMEADFGRALAQLWKDRITLTQAQRARIIEITKESFID